MFYDPVLAFSEHHFHHNHKPLLNSKRKINTDTTTPDIPQKQCPSHPVRRVCGLGDVTTSLKENEYYDSSLRVKKRVSKRLCDLPTVTQLKSNDTKILKQACVTPNPVKLPLHYTCKTCC